MDRGQNRSDQERVGKRKMADSESEREREGRERDIH